MQELFFQITVLFCTTYLYFLFRKSFMQREDPSKFRQSKQSKNVESKVDKIIKECIEQNQIFSIHEAKHNWRAIHQAHYDWWAFPIDQKSSYGLTYKVFSSQIDIMKQTPQFMAALKSNAIIVCKAWGWDLTKGQKILTDHKDQKWQNWPIRLYKMARSLQIFGLKPLFEHTVKYGLIIMKQSGKKLHYGRRDISAYFEQKWAHIKNDPTEEKFQAQKKNQSKEETSSKRTQSLWTNGMNQMNFPVQKQYPHQKQTNEQQKMYTQKGQKKTYCELFRDPLICFRK